MWLSALRLSSCVLTFTWLGPSAYGYQLIDTHHHFVPDFYREGELTAFAPYMIDSPSSGDFSRRRSFWVARPSMASE